MDKQEALDLNPACVPGPAVIAFQLQIHAEICLFLSSESFNNSQTYFKTQSFVTFGEMDQPQFEP